MNTTDQRPFAGSPATLNRYRRPDAEIARSWLLVPGSAQHAQFVAAADSQADALILDIEDAIDPRQKPAARSNVINWLNNGGQAWVRINDASTSFWADDVEQLAGVEGLLGVMLAKTENPDQVRATHTRLGRNLPVIALIESAKGIEAAPAIAEADGVFRLAFESGDFRRDTGMSADPEAMAYPRARLTVASRVGSLPGPIDGPTVGTAHEVLREQSATTVLMGMTGKLCLDPAQAPVINEAISPTPTDIAWAAEFLDDFAARGKVIRDGSDLPRLGRAEKIMNLAIALGLHSALTSSRKGR